MTPRSLQNSKNFTFSPVQVPPIKKAAYAIFGTFALINANRLASNLSSTFNTAACDMKNPAEIAAKFEKIFILDF